MGIWMWTIYALAVSVAILVYPYLGGGPPRTLHPVNPDDPPTLPSDVTRKVLIIGGGWSGLTAALELADRGFEVTVKEKQPFLGGRYSNQKFIVIGEEFHLSACFHACFHNYHNFKRIRRSLDVDKYYVPWQDNHFAFRDYEWENIYSLGHWPFNLVGMILRSPNLSLWTAMKAWRVSLDFILYNHKAVYEDYDHLTFDEWAKLSGVVPEFGDIWLKPGISASLNNITYFSAAEFLMYSHFFFISGAEAEHREYSTVNSAVSLINPWKKKLKQLGVKFELGKAVKALQFNQESEETWHVNDVSDLSVTYDHVILAVDLRAAQDIASRSIKNSPAAEVALRKMASKLDHLPLAQPFKILKVWFDKQLTRDRHHPVLQTPQHNPINVIVQLHYIEDQYRTWAKKTKGSVMEFHLYSWNYGEISDDKIWDFISPVVLEIYPEIFEDNFKILASFVHTGKNVASFASGSAKYRPRPTSPEDWGLPNLSLAGDWLRTDYPSALMERAISTGIEAANHVLFIEGVQQVPLIVTTSSGPGII